MAPTTAPLDSQVAKATQCPVGEEDIILNGIWIFLAQAGSSIAKDFTGGYLGKRPSGGLMRFPGFCR